MSRTFSVKCTLAPGLTDVGIHTIKGSFSFGAYDAAKRFTLDSLIGYSPIPGGIQIDSKLWVFNAINHELQLSALIYVTEV